MHDLRNLVRNARRQIRRFLSMPTLWYAIDRVVIGRVQPPSPAGPVVLIAPPGRGNIGDQALVEACLENIGGSVSVVCRSEGDFDLAKYPEAREVPRPGLIYGGFAAHALAMFSLRRVLRSADRVFIIGADVMDGSYNLRASFARSSLAAAVARGGGDARILGFSWNASPQRKALIALRRAGRCGATILLRDPESYRRAERDGVSNIEKAADVVFASDAVAASLPSDVADLVERTRLKSSRIALVNVSGLIRSLDQTDEYRVIVDYLLRNDHAVIVVPHVSRSGADDLVECKKLASHYKSDTRVALIPRLLDPSMIRLLARGASVVVTGRMHLSVMSLSQSVPAITLATQGKVEGLMRYFDRPEFCVSPSPGFGSSVVTVLSTIESDRDGVAAGIRQRLANVRELAGVNFSDNFRVTIPRSLSGTAGRN